MKYKDFLEKKSIIDQKSGFKVLLSDLNGKLFDWQKALVQWALLKGSGAIFADCGLGKGQPYGTKILTSKGWCNNNNLTSSDKVIGSDGKPYLINGVFFKPIQNTYRIYFRDGISYVTDEDHLHIVRTNNDRQRKKPWKVLSTKELINCNLRYGKNQKSRNYDIPVVSPVQFKNKKLIIPPYVFGALLGDGGFTQPQISFSSIDKEIVNRIKDEIGKNYKLKTNNKKDYNIA